MKLSAIRDLGVQDDLGGLGPKVTPAPTTAPAPVPIGGGIVRHPDGKLSTDLPEPPTVAPAPKVTPPALKAGDHVRFFARSSEVAVVTWVFSNGFFGAKGSSSTFANWCIADEGKTWERA